MWLAHNGSFSTPNLQAGEATATRHEIREQRDRGLTTCLPGNTGGPTERGYIYSWDRASSWAFSCLHSSHPTRRYKTKQEHAVYQLVAWSHPEESVLICKTCVCTHPAIDALLCTVGLVYDSARKKRKNSKYTSYMPNVVRFLVAADPRRSSRACGGVGCDTYTYGSTTLCIDWLLCAFMYCWLAERFV